VIAPFEGVAPRIHPGAWVAPNAVVLGDVEIGEGASVWYGCVLRGDTNFIRIGARSNIQDGTIIHVNAGREATVIGADVTVGHAAIIHACTLEMAPSSAWERPSLTGRSWKRGGARRLRRAAAGQAHPRRGTVDGQPGQAGPPAGAGSPSAVRPNGASLRRAGASPCKNGSKVTKCEGGKHVVQRQMLDMRYLFLGALRFFPACALAAHATSAQLPLAQ
jgi:hypothetical protein